MLYDPKWEAPTKTDPFSLPSLIAWLEKQPADKIYDYCDPHNCMLCQYFTAMGFRAVSVWLNNMEHSGGLIKFSCVFNSEIANSPTTRDTFGAALARARAALATSECKNGKS